MTQSKPTGWAPEVPVADDCLGSGTAGIALLHIERARTGRAPWASAHEWAVAMTRGPVRAHPDTADLYRGAPAVAFTLHTAAHPGYQSVLDTLDGHIATLTRHRLDQAQERINRRQLPALREFDLISGLTGIGAYLLHRDRHRALLRDVLAYLVRLTEPVHTHDGPLPGWWSAEPPSGQPAHRWPGGHGNLGLAHGIAGPLALLATAMLRDVTVTGHTAAITTICRWLDRHQVGARVRPWWPGRISRAQQQRGTLTPGGPQRPSWCYGTPGLARSQQLAALALVDPERQRRAEHALICCASDEHQLARLHDATLCHGWAGLVHTTWRAAADSPEDALAAVLPRLRARLAEHLDRHGLPEKPGLLDGKAGIQLVQHTTTADPETTRWDGCLLTSP